MSSHQLLKIIATLLALALIFLLTYDFYNNLFFPKGTAFGISLVIFMGFLVISSTILSTKILQKFDIFSPWMGFPAFLFLIYGIGSLRWVISETENVEILVTLAATGLLSYLTGTLFTINKIAKPDSSRSWNQTNLKIVVFGLFFAGLIGFMLFYYKAGIPIFSDDLLGGRRQIFKKGGNWLLYISRLIAPSFLIYLTYHFNFSSSQSRRFISTIFFIITAGFMLSTASRSDTFFILFTAFIIIYYSRFDKIKLYHLSAIPLIFISIFIYGYYRVVVSNPEIIDILSDMNYVNISASDSISSFLTYIILQLSVYSSNCLLIFDIFPAEIPFQHGKNFVLTLSTILPGNQDTIGMIIKEKAGLEFVGGGVNPTMLGELYLDFGYIYIPVMMFLYGLIYRSFYDKLFTDRSCTSILLYSFLTFCFILSTTGGLFSQLSRWYYLVIFLMSVFIIVSRSLLGVKVRGHNNPASGHKR